MRSALRVLAAFAKSARKSRSQPSRQATHPSNQLPIVRRTLKARTSSCLTRVLPLALALALGGVHPATAADAESGESLTAFADRFDQAQLRKDGPALERMVADDLVFITGSGQRQGKREFIAGWTAAGDRFDPITLVDRVVTPLGDNAGMVSAETVLSGTSDGIPFASRFRFTDTFSRVAGEWRAVHIQVTRIPEPPTK
jgi:ketosteroid isomerase-like protein